jgi:hypothetical protein
LTGSQDISPLRIIRRNSFLAGIILLPVLINRIRDFGQPCPVLDLFRASDAAKNLTLFCGGLPNGFNTRAVTSTGTSCGWPFSTQAALFRRQPRQVCSYSPSRDRHSLIS